MNILSFDIGIKNLAMCLLEAGHQTNEFRILKWDVFDLSGENKQTCIYTKNGKDCTSEAKYHKDDKYYCKLHTKYSEKAITPDDLEYSEIKTYKLANLSNIANKYNIQIANTKNQLLQNIKVYTDENYLTRIKNVKADELNLIDIGIFMRDKLDAVLTPDILSNLDGVIIENQISPLASRMKTIQGMLAQYFIVKNVTNIFFYSAMNKLKIFGNLTTISYAERKKLSVNITKELLDDESIAEWNIYFSKHKKKDDLADSLLQGLSFFVKEKILTAEKFNQFFD